jgi:hypothetical protein
MAGKAVTRSNCLNDAGLPQAVIHNIQKPQTGLLVADRRTGEGKNMITRPRQRLWVRRETAAIRIAPSTKPTMLIAEKINIL